MGLTALSAPGLLVACSDDENTTTTSNSTSNSATSSSTSSSSPQSSSVGQGGQGGAGEGGGGSSQGGSGGDAVGGNGGAGGGQSEQQCWDKIDPNEPCPTLQDAPLYYSCTMDGLKSVTAWLSGPVELGGMCCYEVITEDDCVVIGRPFLIGDEALTAELCARYSDWCRGGAGPRIDDLSPEMREALASAWARDALYEHASVASFGRFALALMALGAPADLVRAAHEAALDEVRHAELCFALASAYRGAPQSPGPLPIPASIEVARDLAELAVSTAIEGCIGETIAAMVAEEQHARAEDPQVRAALASIAADEARHAELAWRSVAWAIEQGGASVRAAVADVFGRAGSHLPAMTGSDDPRLAAHGRLCEQELSRIKRRVLEEVVLPCAAALLAGSAPAERPVELRA
jgi:hypothetical protein